MLCRSSVCEVASRGWCVVMISSNATRWVHFSGIRENDGCGLAVSFIVHESVQKGSGRSITYISEMVTDLRSIRPMTRACIIVNRHWNRISFPVLWRVVVTFNYTPP